jgi:hypothetical protein
MADEDKDVTGETEQPDGPVMELTAAQQVDMQMRQMLAAQLGENAAGSGDHGMPDYYDIFEWDPNPDVADYYALALRNPYAFAVTFLPASTSWRDPPEIVDDAEGTDGQTDFEQDVEELARETNLWDYCKRADKLAGIGDFGVLVLEFDDVQQSDVTDGEDGVDTDAFADPVTDATQLTGLRPFSRLSVSGVEVGGPGSGRWGQPTMYEIDLRDENDAEFDFRWTGGGDDIEQTGPETIRVHHSRVIHVPAGELLDDQVRSIPRQQPVYNNLIDIEKALGSAGELAYRASAWGININIDKDYQLEEDSELAEHLHRWQTGLENVLRTHGADEVQSLGGEEIDPSNIIDPNIEAIASQPYMPPQSVLKGNETGERATSEDLKSWYGDLQGRRQTYNTPQIARPVIDRCIRVGVLTPPVNGPSAYSVNWLPFAELSEKEIADMQGTRAETLERQVDLGLTRQQRVDYLREGTLPTEVQDVSDDVGELEDVEAAASEARSVEEMAAEYEAVADGGETDE